MSSSKPVSLFFFFFYFLFFSSSSALNITSILSEYSDFSTFSNLLDQTKVSESINSRQTITVLVVNNAAFSSLSGEPDTLVKNILSLHVILDYFDQQKLQNLEKKTAILTTLYQSSGQAKDQQGFLNVTHLSDGSIAFGSAVPGAERKAKLVKSVASQPYNISILQVSSVIVPPGLTASSQSNSNSTTETPSSSSPSPTKSPAPGASPAAPTPANKENQTDAPDQAPAPSAAAGKSPGSSPSKAPTPSMAGSPNASSPTPAEEPAAAESPTDIAPSDGTSPMGSPPEPTAGGASEPAADGPASDGPSSDGSSPAPINGVKVGALAVIFASTWSLF
ncbi:hypothetical protein ACOSQ4_021402 [Xanthoceras sorbifolium]